MQLTPLQKSTKGGSSLTLFIVCLVLSGALLFFLVLPKYSAYKAAKETATNDHQTLENLKQEQTKVTALFEQIKRKDEDLKRVDLAIPDKAGVPELYAYIETLAKSVNLKISSLQAKDESEQLSTGNKLIGVPDTAGITGVGGGAAPGAGGTKNTSLSPTLGVVDIDLQLTGSLADYITFLGAAQNSLRIIDVQGINIGASETGDTGNVVNPNPSLKFISSLKTYYQKQK